MRQVQVRSKVAETYHDIIRKMTARSLEFAHHAHIVEFFASTDEIKATFVFENDGKMLMIVVTAHENNEIVVYGGYTDHWLRPVHVPDDTTLDRIIDEWFLP